MKRDTDIPSSASASMLQSHTHLSSPSFCSLALMNTWTSTHVENTQLWQQFFKTPLNQHIMTKGKCTNSDCLLYGILWECQTSIFRVQFLPTLVFVWLTERWIVPKSIDYSWLQETNGQNAFILTSKARLQEV